jgi:hypothetical protein
MKATRTDYMDVIDSNSPFDEDREITSIEPVRGELWFDTWLCAQGERLKDLVASMVGGLAHFEKSIGGRVRARKPKDLTTFEETIEAVVVNLAYGLLNPTPKGSAVALFLKKDKKPSRYDNKRIKPKTLRKVIDLMEKLDALVLRVGQSFIGTSSILATDWFASLARQKGVSNEDFGRREGEEVIILSRSKGDRKLDGDGYDPNPRGGRLDYEDSPEIDAYRSEVVALNAFLKAADIVFIDDDLEPVVQAQSRTLKRHFSYGKAGWATAWKRNGRLFGGFWINLKRHRRSNIRIDGEPVRLLDFSSMFVRLAYAQVGAEPPEDQDLYDMTGELAGYDNDLHRDGVKKGFNALLNGGKAGSPEILAALPSGTRPKAFREAVAAKHTVLRQALEKGPRTAIGMGLMFKESQVLLGCLNRLMAANIVALPIHDGILVAQSCAEEAERAMREAAIEHVGYPLPVKVKDPTG